MTESGSATSLESAAGTWQLDPSATTIEIHTKAMWGLAKVNGTFRAVSGRGFVGEHGAISGDLVVDATSIDTNNKKRDEHLRSEEFFDVSKYPTFTFSTSEAVPSSDGTLAIKGVLAIKDRSEPVDLVATWSKPSSDRVTLHGEATVERSKLGMTWAKMGAGLVNRVVVAAQFVRS